MYRRDPRHHHGPPIKQDEIHSSMHPSPRGFPPPWSVEDQEACFVVRDRDGQALAYIYYEEEPGAALSS
jgi:hypothetical protein